ncbi:MAG: GNAT family N-acetyltransferase [Candidatus Eisenbacteria bacterium]|uniref:GNAT family N-acetyltransferase n=1 Tax=Eiseniibacteriota bacterium TaxID=2212470 RepID=A0A849SSM9_UNCEI|nr:GNAT family N-acetyltransferase [Candidatus Eisenbacteria bacterium]
MSRATERTRRSGSRTPALRYRSARRTDVESLADLGARAYRVASLEKRRSFYTEHPRFTLRDVRVGEVGGEIVASLVLYPLEAAVRGRHVPMVGVGSVAVAPEHRRRGLGEAMMRAALREMRTAGRGLSMLYPFRASFYRKLGWGLCELVQQYAFAPANLTPSDEARHVRRLRVPDRPRVQALYDQVAAGGHFTLARSEAWWSRRLWEYPGDWVVYAKGRGAIEGYLYYEADPSKGPFKLALSVSEIVAATPEAHRGLIGHLATLRDQVEEIHLAAPARNAWPHLLRDAQNLHPGSEIGAYHDTGNLAHGAYLRLVDVKAALEALPIATGTRGELTLEVEDALLPSNARVWRVKSDGGARLAVTPSRAAAPAPAHARTSVETLASLVSGALPARAANHAALLEATPAAIELFEAWYPGGPAFLHPFNAF